jgi:hypothetical protein
VTYEWDTRKARKNLARRICTKMLAAIVITAMPLGIMLYTIAH